MTSSFVLSLAFYDAGNVQWVSTPPQRDRTPQPRHLEPEDTNGIRIVYLSGKPYQMGYQQGVLLSEELGALL